MKIFYLTLATILFLSSAMFSTSVAQDSVKVHSLEKGSWALMFELSGNLMELRMQDFMGRTFSGKFHTRDNRAWRLGLDIRAGSSTSNRTNKYGFDNAARIDNINNSSQSYDVTAQYLWYLRSNKNIHFFVGLGPQLFYYKAKSSRYTVETNPDEGENSLMESATSQYGLGIAGSLGVECFIVSNFSFIAEYNTAVRYHVSEDKSNRFKDSIIDTESDSDRTSVSLYTMTVKIGLSFYF